MVYFTKKTSGREVGSLLGIDVFALIVWTVVVVTARKSAFVQQTSLLS